MKRVFLLASVLLMGTALFAQQKKAEDLVRFKELVFDFGKVKQNVPAVHDFVFANISDAPVVIESVMASCGCTTPFKPEGAISKGKSDKITASFNAMALGPFNKTITVKVAGADTPIQLRIVGDVLTPDAYTKYEEEKTGKKSGS
jgi:hypothetical protein